VKGFLRFVAVLIGSAVFYRIAFCDVTPANLADLVTGFAFGMVLIELRRGEDSDGIEDEY
jgi:hypothetical protein